MAPRNPEGNDTWLRHLARLPWWLPVLGAGLVYLGLHRLAPGDSASGQIPGTDLGHLVRALAGLGQWLIPGALLLASGIMAHRRRRARLLCREVAADPLGTALRDLGRSDFEALVAEVFRQQDYQVGGPLAGPDGGAGEMLLTRRDERSGVPPPHPASPAGTSPPLAVVHARQWRAWQVGAAEVQGLIAAMRARGAGRGFLVIPGEFTRDARRLAEGKSIELIDGARLRALLRAGAVTLAAAASPRPRRRLRIPVRPLLRLAGVLLAAAAILGGFRWILSLPDKRLGPAEPPRTAEASPPPGPTLLVPEPPATPAATEPPTPPPPPGLGGFRSVQELDAAFEAFYIPPPGCASPGSHAEMVECANHRIRARRGYMAAGTPAEPELAPGPEEGQEEVPAWDNSDAAINALAPLRPPQPDAAESPPAPAGTPGPAPEPPPRLAGPKEKDPAATYVPYDPKAPWVEP